MSEEEKIELSEDFIKTIGSLNEMCSQHENMCAAMLYRLMFKHERNIRILDSYADGVLDALLGFGGEYAEEDYRNYLQYLSFVIPKEYEGHKEMFENNLKDLEDDGFNDDELQNEIK